jgi:FKBP-type peptidyl-prolyl cis-trans isomerase SlyD
MQIATNTVVTIDYTLKDDDQSVLDTSQGQEPLSYIHGIGNLIPGLEKALAGKSEGDRVQVTIAPDDAYGERDEDLLQAIPRERFERANEIEVGMQFHTQSDEGMQVVTVVGVDGDNITIDGNHPLAGKTLHFDVQIVGVREASADEISHGHVHGEGGHHH